MERATLLVGDGEGERDAHTGAHEKVGNGWGIDIGFSEEEEEKRLEERARRAVSFRILPLFFLSALLCYIDRTNMAFAADGLQSELELSDTQYGLGASVFFITYATCGVPGTLFAKRIGVKYGLAIMLVSWGAVSALMALVRDLSGLIVLRLLMGAAEAGTFPTMLLHLTTFYGDNLGTVYTSAVCAATALSGIIGGPLAALILSVFSGVGGVSSWRWLFFIEGLPTIGLGLAVLYFLPNSAESCGAFLQPRELKCLMAALNKMQAEKAASSSPDRHVETEALALDQSDGAEDNKPGSGRKRRRGALSVICEVRVLLLATSMLLWNLGYYGVIYWLPIVLNGTASSDGEGETDEGRGMAAIALLTSIPYSLGAVTMISWAAHSDRTGERLWHTAIADWTAGTGLALTAVALGSMGDAQSSIWTTAIPLATLSVAVAGVWSMYGPFFSFAREILPSDDAAAGFSFINSAASLGGVFGPFFMGVLKEKTGAFVVPMGLLATCSFLSGVLVLQLRRFRNRRKVMEAIDEIVVAGADMDDVLENAD